MSARIHADELIATAKEKLGGVRACLNDSGAFGREVRAFDDWLSANKAAFSHAAELSAAIRTDIADVITQISRLEMQAHHNARLVTDMQSYLNGQLETRPLAAAGSPALRAYSQNG